MHVRPRPTVSNLPKSRYGGNKRGDQPSRRLRLFCNTSHLKCNLRVRQAATCYVLVAEASATPCARRGGSTAPFCCHWGRTAFDCRTYVRSIGGRDPDRFMALPTLSARYSISTMSSRCFVFFLLFVVYLLFHLARKTGRHPATSIRCRIFCPHRLSIFTIC